MNRLVTFPYHENFEISDAHGFANENCISFIKSEKLVLVLSVTFWFRVGLRTEFCDHAEKNGEEKFSCASKRNGATLKCQLYNDRSKSGILPEDLEYKNCPLDLTLTDMWWQHSTAVDRTFLMTGCSWTSRWEEFAMRICNLRKPKHRTLSSIAWRTT